MNTLSYSSESLPPMIDLVPTSTSRPPSSMLGRLFARLVIIGVVLVGTLLVLRVGMAVFFHHKLAEVGGDISRVSGLDSRVADWLQTTVAWTGAFAMMGLGWALLARLFWPWSRFAGGWRAPLLLLILSGLGAAVPATIGHVRGVAPDGLPARLTEIDRPMEVRWFGRDGEALIYYSIESDATLRFWDAPGKTPDRQLQTHPVTGEIRMRWEKGMAIERERREALTDLQSAVMSARQRAEQAEAAAARERERAKAAEAARVDTDARARLAAQSAGHVHRTRQAPKSESTGSWKHTKPMQQRQSEERSRVDSAPNTRPHIQPAGDPTPAPQSTAHASLGREPSRTSSLTLSFPTEMCRADAHLDDHWTGRRSVTHRLGTRCHDLLTAGCRQRGLTAGNGRAPAGQPAWIVNFSKEISPVVERDRVSFAITFRVDEVDDRGFVRRQLTFNGSSHGYREFCDAHRIAVDEALAALWTAFDQRRSAPDVGRTLIVNSSP